jgi:spore maturation protein CgeB
MEHTVQIEKACSDNDHETIIRAIDTMKSEELKKESFLKIINYYEKRESRLPVGYYVRFIEWLLKTGDVDTAGDYVERLNRLGVTKKRISELIYEYVIKPDEAHYREKFERNIALLKENRILISEHSFDFAHVSRNIPSIRNYHREFSAGMIGEENTSLMAVDVMDFQLIEDFLMDGHFLYIVYRDLKKLYFMLMFEDFGAIEKYIVTGNIVILADNNYEDFRRFFMNMKVITPQYILARNDVRKYYDDIISEIRNERRARYALYLDKLETLYKDKDFSHYQQLFDRDPSSIRVLLITSELTDLNKYIVKNWYETFLEMGYTAELLIETEPYERMLIFYITEQICHFRPDIVFHVNHPVNSIFDQPHIIRDNLLWIMRYRDKIHEEIYGGNTFFLPIHNWFSESLQKCGISKNRIFTTPDSVSFKKFRKKGTINSKYVCDITCVNNAGGAESFRLNHFIKHMRSDKARKLLRDLFEDLKEMLADEHVFSPVDFNYFIDQRMQKLGIAMPDGGKEYLVAFAAQTMESLYRGRVIEWIIESKITPHIKLWGKHWSNVKIFEKYHMGVAGYGEELASIYENSRISISDVFWLHERNFEILASGGFPLVKYKELDESVRENTITNYFRENEEIVVFYSKDDLLNKIQYYLDNPDERKNISDRGRQVVTDNFSRIAIARKTMNFIKDYYRG